jgi:hypothetical protein
MSSRSASTDGRSLLGISGGIEAPIYADLHPAHIDIPHVASVHINRIRNVNET